MRAFRYLEVFSLYLFISPDCCSLLRNLHELTVKF